MPEFLRLNMPTHCVGAAGHSGALKGRTCQHAVATEAMQQCINLLQQLPPGGELEDISVTWRCFGVPILTMAVLTVAVPCRASPPSGNGIDVALFGQDQQRPTVELGERLPKHRPVRHRRRRVVVGMQTETEVLPPHAPQTCANTTESSGCTGC